MAEIADCRLCCAERASSGVGCSRNDRVSAVARSRSSRAGGYALVASPIASPEMTGSMPDLNIATQIATRQPDRDRAAAERRVAQRDQCRRTARSRRPAPRTRRDWRRRSRSPPARRDRRRPPASAGRRECGSRSAGSPGPRLPSANAVSVDIAAAQPCAPLRPALKAR